MEIEYLNSYISLIERFYGNGTADRSGVPLINHIYEGLHIMRSINASDQAMAAFAVHPIIQGDEQLVANRHLARCFEPAVMLLAMEYRKTANGYLCTKYTDKWTQQDIRRHAPIVLLDVETMLVADKVQNYKDFTIYHKDSHPRSKQLDKYFNNWLKYLSVSKNKYIDLLYSLEYEYNKEEWITG